MACEIFDCAWIDYILSLFPKAYQNGNYAQ